MEVIREAKVIDTNDPLKKGKIKVRIYPEMIDLQTTELPWIGKYSIGTGLASTQGIHEIPEINSFIRVVIEDYPFMKRIRYISDDYVEGLYIYNTKITSISATELSTQTYPQPFFKCYKDGTIDFHNSVTGEHGVFYKGGGYQLVDSNGNFFSNAKTKGIKAYNNNGVIELKANGHIELNGSSKKFVTWDELNTQMQIFVLALNLLLSTKKDELLSTPGSLVLDLSSAKTTTVLTNG